jgi:hypothetical protein
MRLWLVLALCAPFAFGQVDPGALRAKYGPPVEEVFTLRPEITLSVSYGDNHQLCKLELRSTKKAEAVPTALIEELLNEIIPPAVRGTPGRGFMACTGINCWQMAEYERLSIGQAAGATVSPPNALATVQFKGCVTEPRP